MKYKKGKSDQHSNVSHEIGGKRELWLSNDLSNGNIKLLKENEIVSTIWLSF